jgi:hypothetical protein
MTRFSSPRTTTTLFVDDRSNKKIDIATVGLRPDVNASLYKVSNKDDALSIADYIISMKSEINPSDHYKTDVIKLLRKLSIFCGKDSPFKQITRQDLLSFLDNFKKPEESNPLHKWIGTYNLYTIHLIRFFKWLYYPDIEPSKGPKPSVVQIFLN